MPYYWEILKFKVLENLILDLFEGYYYDSTKIVKKGKNISEMSSNQIDKKIYGKQFN
jgi:hypothetical protein